MAARGELHPDEEIIERYSLGRLSARPRRHLEQHLLVCARCRRALSNSDAFIAAMRQAAARLRIAERPAKRTRKGKIGTGR